MAAQVLSFFQRTPRQAPVFADWSQQELAEFYRVEGALMRAGIRVGTDRGMSDENEPWFVFYRSDDGEVVIHFARIDGEYIIAGPAYEEIARGLDFTALVRNMVARHPMVRRPESNDNISIHPAALLVAVVGTAFFKTGEARAAETTVAHNAAPATRPALLSSSASAPLKNNVAPMATPQPTYDSVQLPANQAVLILAAALLASDYGVVAPTVDSAAHTAIAAAAAGLDFGGGASVTSASGGALPLSGASHVAAVDSSPAHMVSSVLSLVALLSTHPTVESGAVSNGGPSIASIAHQDFSTTTWTAPLPADPANWSLDVHLTPGVLPTVEAVQLVRGIFGDANFQKITVVEVAQLPDVLADLIARGVHYATAPTQAQPVTVDPVTPPPANDGDVHGAGAASASTGAGSSVVTTGDASTPAATATTDPTPAKPAPSAPPVVYASQDLAKQFIDYFMNHTDHVSIMMQGQKVVMYDDRVLHDIGTVDHVTSVTFDFMDGSAINLVGAHSAFLTDGNLV